MPKQPDRQRRIAAMLGLAVFACSGLSALLVCRGILGRVLREGGLEPPRVTPQEPKSCASASSATRAGWPGAAPRAGAAWFVAASSRLWLLIARARRRANTRPARARATLRQAAYGSPAERRLAGLTLTGALCTCRPHAAYASVVEVPLTGRFIAGLRACSLSAQGRAICW